MSMLNDLRFDALFEMAVGEWPPCIEVAKQVIYPNGNVHYPELWSFPDAIIEKYLGTSEEVIMRQLHDAVGFAVRDAAGFITCIRPAELRRSTVRRDFESILRERIRPEDGWKPEDFALINAYFYANRGESSPAMG